MHSKLLSFALFFWIGLFFANAQETEEPADVVAQDTSYVETYLPLKPAKVAFYSAILPGLGQAYNKDYWKVPIVYAALGTGVGVAIYNHKEFQRYRTAYKDRIAGRDDEFTIRDDEGTIVNQVFTNDNLIDAQDFFRRRKELAILVTAGLYVLQIIEANVDAHLSQYNVDERLSLNPFVERNDYSFSNTFGLSLTYNF